MNPSMDAQRASHEMGICPAFANSPSELARTMAQIMVMTPTLMARPMQNFSILEICRFHNKRIGRAMTGGG